MAADPATLVAPPGPMVPTLYRVLDRRDELSDTVTLFLRPTDGAIPAPAPGQFTMLWAIGVGEAPISVAGVEPDGVLRQTIRRVGAVTEALADLERDAEVGVRGPYGSRWDLDAAEGDDIVVVAGGLGIAPVRPIVTQLIAERDRFGAVAVLFGARAPDQLLYPDEIGGWRARFDLDVEVTVDTADPSWRGDVGVVTKLVDRARFRPDHTTAFVCGPEIMMRYAAVAVAERGVAADRIRLSLERNMHCAVGHCGHCQLGSAFVCKDGPVLTWEQTAPLLEVRSR